MFGALQDVANPLNRMLQAAIQMKMYQQAAEQQKAQLDQKKMMQMLQLQAAMEKERMRDDRQVRSQEYGTGEREARQEYGTSEREATETFRRGEREAGQQFRIGERQAGEAFRGSEAEKNRQARAAGLKFKPPAKGYADTTRDLRLQFLKNKFMPQRGLMGEFTEVPGAADSLRVGAQDITKQYTKDRLNECARKLSDMIDAGVPDTELQAVLRGYGFTEQQIKPYLAKIRAGKRR